MSNCSCIAQFYLIRGYFTIHITISSKPRSCYSTFPTKLLNYERVHMPQFIYTMQGVGKVVPPKREILKNIWLSFYPGAKIGVLGLNGSGKSTLLKIMAGIDKEFNGEARPQPGIKIGYLQQEPQLDPKKNVRGNVEEGVSESMKLLNRYN